MASIRITTFGGITNDVSPRLMPDITAQIAHNCLLWDGSLRTLDIWSSIQGVDYSNAYSIYLSEDNQFVYSTVLQNAVPMRGHMYAPQTQVGLVGAMGENYANIFFVDNKTSITGQPVGIPKPIVTGSVSYTRQNKSQKAVNRMYAVSGIRVTSAGVQESTLTLIPGQSEQSIIYEGDTANISVAVASPYVGYDGVRLYRTLTGMDTGSGVANELDTEFHLIHEQRGVTGFSYSDAGAATNDPLDVYLARDFYPPALGDYRFIDVTEGGWLVAASRVGAIIASERHMYHAWPPENRWDIAETITDLKAQYDTVYVGTKNYPYSITLAPGERLALQGGVFRYPENYECLPGTMDSTPSGAIYASPSGLVSLSREGMQLVTAGVVSGVKALYQIEYRYPVTDDEGNTTVKTRNYPMRFQHTAYGLYYHGNYFGFTQVDSGMLDDSDEPLYFFKGYMANLGSSIDGAKPLSKFVTLDTPMAIRAHTIGGSGIYVLASDGVYSMPFPDSVGNEAYHRAKKYCYTWKSRKFVMPGETVFAAAKVDHDCGPVRLRIYADCCCVYDVSVTDCKPFLLPPNIVGTVIEVELQGSATVHEVHIATSLRDLLEHGNGIAR